MVEHSARSSDGASPDPSTTGPFPVSRVVGIGASAGGLEALQDLTSQLRPGSGASYVVAQHLAPDHPSLIVDLLARGTRLEVVTAHDAMTLRPDVIAITPPNHDVVVEGDRLRISDPVPRYGPSPSVDLLFESIATHWGERGVAVVLSGTGSDGARGLLAVRTAGGLTVVQSPEEAKFDGMPRAALSLGSAELCLEAGLIGRRLGDLLRSGEEGIGRALPLPEPVPLGSVTAQLKHATGIDFSQYKESTLQRQVQRRMAIRQVSHLEDYLPLLASDEGEPQALMGNLLVTVTSFFRDPQAFEALQELLARCVRERGSSERLRLWVPGCATGEELYSLAMVVSEVLGHPLQLSSQLKIFGTDLDESSLAVARRGLYPAAAAAAIPSALRERFVIESSGWIEIRETLRDCAVFARHNVSEDPPFPRLDLISCRNTLIYFTPPLQERVLSLFRFGLQPGGLLFMGSSESLGNRTPGFCVADAEHRIYRRSSEAGGRLQPPVTLKSAYPTDGLAPMGLIKVVRESVPEQHVALLEALVRHVGPPCLVLDEHHDLVEVIGDVAPYCRLPQGRASSAATAFLRPELQAQARALLLLARADKSPVRSALLQLDGIPAPLHLEARPLPVGTRPFTLLSFVPELGTPELHPPSSGAGSDDRDATFDREIERLERELLASQDSLRRSLAELEGANEELEASAEELQASSEELQSSNEELEASNEELQATNEELGTLNQQLRARGEELQLLNTDLENIQNSLSQGMVMVDSELRVTRFTPLAVRVFGLVDTDLGQPLLGVPTTVPLPGLREALQAVVAGEARRSIEASSEEVSYLAQVLPYQERNGRRLGAIVTLTDVFELVALRRAAEATLSEFARLTDALEEAVWKRDLSMRRMLYASKRIQALTGWSPQELCDRPTLLDAAIDPADRERVEESRDICRDGWSVRYRIRTRSGQMRWIVEAAKVMNEGSDHFVVGTLTDVTERRAIEEQARDSASIFESVFHTGSFGVLVLDVQGRVLMANERIGQLVGMGAAALEGVPAPTLISLPDEEAWKAALNAALAAPGSDVPCNLRLQHRDGSQPRVVLEIRGLPRPIGTAVLRVIVRELPTVTAD